MDLMPERITSRIILARIVYTNRMSRAMVNYGNQLILNPYSQKMLDQHCWLFELCPDYDAPLSESGDYTAKYYRILEALTRYQIPELRRPLLPTPSAKFAYPPIRVESYLTFSDILDQVPASHKFEVENRMPMENLPINSDSGQSQGYVLYRKMASGFSANARFMVY